MFDAVLPCYLSNILGRGRNRDLCMRLRRKAAGGSATCHRLTRARGLPDCVPFHGPLSIFLHLSCSENHTKEIRHNQAQRDMPPLSSTILSISWSIWATKLVTSDNGALRFSIDRAWCGIASASGRLTCGQCELERGIGSPKEPTVARHNVLE